MTSRFLLYFYFVCSTLPFFSLGKTTIRLQPNTAGSGVSGILQVKHNGKWGTVCNDEWDMKDTVVACRQLGFAKAVRYWKYGTGHGPVLLNWMKCTGLETTLGECNHVGWGVSSSECDRHVHDIGVVCSSHTGAQFENASLRLQSGTQGFSFAGILQVYRNNQWGTVCFWPSTWQITDTRVACTQLGFSEAVGMFWHEARGEGKVWMKDVRCTGNEKSLQSCSHDIVKENDANCKTHRFDIGIVCSGFNNVRLVGGGDGNEGRIQVKLEGNWGTVCGDYGWTIENSNVICRMLGHKRAVRNQNFGAGIKSQPIWLQQLSCKGCEMSIAECQITNYSLPNCSHKNDVGVVCLPKDEANITVRLVAENKNSIRRVEVRYYGIWRSICTNNWDIRDANVICRMNGYERASVAMATRKGSNDKVWLDYLDCSGKETTIDDCKNVMWNWKNQTCSNDLRAGVVCFLKDELKLNFHIVNRTTTPAGQIEVESYGKRGNLCIDRLNLNAAHVICRILEYQKAVTLYSMHQQSMTSFSLSLRCDGSEHSTDKCTDVSLNQVDRCYNDEVAGIVCKPKIEYNEKEELRLVKGSGDHEGRVEVKYHGVWGTVCSDGWDMLDANVVCRMKGYQGAITAYEKFPQGSGPIWLTGLDCKGHENSTFDCDREGLDKTKSCSHKSDVGVVCYSGKGHLQVSLEMDNSSSLYEGRVKIKVNNETGTIDDEQWDIHDAHVVCRMLKLSRAIAAISLFREEPGKVFFSKVRCNGTEESLEMCDHGGWGAGTQDHLGYDAGVICARPSIAQAMMMDSSGSNDGAVTGLSILIVILIMVIVGAFLWYFFKLRNEKNKDFQDKKQGLQLERQVASGSGGNVTEDYYQAPPSLGDQRYITSQESDRAVRQTRGKNARNVQESEESMYLEVRR